MVFGDCLHRYSIADGIRDGNVLGFDPYMVLTYRDKGRSSSGRIGESESRDG